MITLTSSKLISLDRYNSTTVTGHRSHVPLGPPSPSFPPLIGLGESEICLICHHLGVFTVFLAQRGIRIRDLNARRDEGHDHFLVLGSETTDLSFLSCHV